MKLGMASAALALTAGAAFAGRRGGTARAFSTAAARTTSPRRSAAAVPSSAAAFVSSRRTFCTEQSSLRSTAEEAAAEAATASTTTTSSEDVDYDGDDSSIYARQSEELSKLESSFLITMRDRGFLHQCTNIAELDDALSAASSSGEAVSAYLGFDATADSLHVGSLLQIMILRHLQKCGHRPVVLIGGGTSKVGDPTGKDESRPQLTDDIIKRNTDGISKVFAKFLTFEEEDADAADADDAKGGNPNDAVMVNNDDWLSELSYLQFLRDYGTQFTINRMLSFESVKQRLAREAPLTFLEFNYMILQAYDFLELARRYDVKLQLGGSDQWGNMVSGTELGRRVDGKKLFALTAPLITTSDGKKMGKTAGGAIWLNSDRLSEYDYWQFWRNTSDEDVVRFLKLFTELPLEDVAELERLKGADINRAKVVLADEATALLHGRDCLKKIHETTQSMFGAKKGAGADQNTDSLPRITVTSDRMEGDGVRFAELFLELKFATSKKDARRLIQGGGARLGDDKITDDTASLTMADFGGGKEVTLRAGKKRAGVVELVSE